MTCAPTAWILCRVVGHMMDSHCLKPRSSSDRWCGWGLGMRSGTWGHMACRCVRWHFYHLFTGDRHFFLFRGEQCQLKGKKTHASFVSIVQPSLRRGHGIRARVPRLIGVTGRAGALGGRHPAPHSPATCRASAPRHHIMLLLPPSAGRGRLHLWPATRPPDHARLQVRQCHPRSYTTGYRELIRNIRLRIISLEELYGMFYN